MSGVKHHNSNSNVKLVIAVAVMIYKTLHRKPKMEQYEPLKNGDELRCFGRVIENHFTQTDGESLLQNSTNDNINK